MGALNVNAATNPSDADTAASAFASRSIITNAPSLTRFQACYWVLQSDWQKLLHLRLM
jgi:hypothetical protein